MLSSSKARSPLDLNGSDFSALGRTGKIDEVVDAVMYLNDAKFVTGEVLHADGGAHAGKW